jgi:quercetin dioxygenase-like cupin family protein
MENFNESVLNLINLAEYQNDAIVSKTIYKGSAGTFTLFAFDKGQSLSEHTAPFDAIVQIIDGKAEVKIQGVLYTLNTGDMIIMPANKPHAVFAVDRFKMLLTMFNKT